MRPTQPIPVLRQPWDRPGGPGDSTWLMADAPPISAWVGVAEHVTESSSSISPGSSRAIAHYSSVTARPCSPCT